LNFYKRHLGDIAKSCSDLSQGQMGAYDLLLDWHYANEKPLPLAADKLYRIGRAYTPQERANVDSVMVELFVKTDAGYTHKRAAEEMAKATAQAETNRAIAVEREAKKRARSEHESCDEPLDESCTNRQPIQTPDSRLHTEPNGSVGEARKRATRKCPQPFDVTAEMLAWAAENVPTVNVDGETAKFVDHTFKTAISDWSGAWRNWLRKAAEFAPRVVSLNRQEALEQRNNAVGEEWEKTRASV
jgi:uncharacterized protein YdaU (DUF1376 family)